MDIPFRLSHIQKEQRFPVSNSYHKEEVQIVRILLYRLLIFQLLYRQWNKCRKQHLPMDDLQILVLMRLLGN